jgi:acyl-coenzyme A synthetase/AMP-(fatty) acid ligase
MPSADHGFFSMADLPLISHRSPAAVFARQHGREIRVDEFLGEARRLAGGLPDRKYVVNLCVDRYHFAVAFAAALLRGQISLFPPNSTADLLARLGRCYDGMYCLADAPEGHAGLETVVYRGEHQSGKPEAAIAPIPQTQIAAIAFTSGSTGQPVAHLKSWDSLVKSARAGIERLGLRDRQGMTVLATVPPQHMYGLESTVLMIMQGGLVLHAGRPFFPADICIELESLARPRGLVTTPVHLRTLLADSGELPRMDFLLCATAPLSPQVAAEAEARFGAPLHEIYGCTETGQIATRRPTETGEWRLFPGVALIEDEKGTWAQGGHVEKEALLGDVIELRGSRRFVLHGRTADLINIAGKRTSLSYLNHHLNSIEGVRDGVFVMPEEDDGTVTRLMAFVVAPDLTNETLTAALRRRIDAAFLPRPLCFVESLPRNETGKLPRLAVNDLVVRLAARAG